MASNVEIVITAVDKTKGTFKNIGGSLGKIGGLALKGAAVGIGLAATAVAGLGVASAKLAIAAAPIKGVQDAFYGLADAAGMGGDKMLKALQEGGVGMVNNENLMKSFNKAAMLVSEDFAVKLPDAMGYLSKVSAATGQDMGFMMDSLVTGVGRLSPMILDNLGIQVKLSDATERAAEMFGVEASALEQTQIQAGMMDVVLEKLKTNTAAMPEVAGSAAQGMAALGVQFDNVKAEIGLALLPIFQKIMTALGEFAEVVMPVVVEYIKTSFIPALERIWEWMSTVLIPFLQDVVFPWIQEYLPQALQILSDFWTNVLKPAIEVVWKWMVDVLMPFLRDVVFPWLKEYIPKALQVLSDFWTGVLKPAITIVWNWMSTVLMPFLQNIVFPWLQEHIPQALQTLSDFWTGVLQPAIEVVWGFISTYLIPIFEVIIKIVGTVLVLAITALKGAWENVLLPALEKVSDFVEKYITPALTWLMDKVIKPLTTALNTGLKKALEWIVKKLDALKQKLEKIKLPGWLTPGSPTPFELGLRGITDAMQELNMTIPKMNMNLTAAGGVATGPSNINNNNFYLTANYEDRDRLSLAQDVKMLATVYG